MIHKLLDIFGNCWMLDFNSMAFISPFELPDKHRLNLESLPWWLIKSKIKPCETILRRENCQTGSVHYHQIFQVQKRLIEPLWNNNNNPFISLLGLHFFCGIFLLVPQGPPFVHLRKNWRYENDIFSKQIHVYLFQNKHKRGKYL